MTFSSSILSFSVRHRQGDFVLDAGFEVGEGLTALFGPSGSGKTTVISALAGEDVGDGNGQRQ